jgi:hypothetical protein
LAAQSDLLAQIILLLQVAAVVVKTAAAAQVLVVFAQPLLQPAAVDRLNLP